MNASVKLLLIVREPVTRAISDYTQLRSHAATAASPQPLAPHKSFEQLALHPDGSVNAAYRPLALSLYHTFMHRWLEVNESTVNNHCPCEVRQTVITSFSQISY